MPNSRLHISTRPVSASASWSIKSRAKRLCTFRTDFLAGQFFDIRLEVHAPVNGSEAIGNPTPDSKFTFTVAKEGRAGQDAASYFKIPEPLLERWNFTWFEGLTPSHWTPDVISAYGIGTDLFAQDAETPSLVNVASKIYRRVALYEPGQYTATLTYYNGTKTTASWLVRDLATMRKTKNIVLFIGVRIFLRHPMLFS